MCDVEVDHVVHTGIRLVLQLFRPARARHSASPKRAMKCAARFGAVAAWALLPSLGAAGSAEVAVTPLQKVVQMLQDMAVTAKKEKQDEEVSFSAFTTWCSNEIANLEGSVKRGAEELSMLLVECQAGQARQARTRRGCNFGARRCAGPT